MMAGGKREERRRKTTAPHCHSDHIASFVSPTAPLLLSRSRAHPIHSPIPHKSNRSVARFDSVPFDSVGKPSVASRAEPNRIGPAKRGERCGWVRCAPWRPAAAVDRRRGSATGTSTWARAGTGAPSRSFSPPPASSSAPGGPASPLLPLSFECDLCRGNSIRILLGRRVASAVLLADAQLRVARWIALAVVGSV